jgi:outer membrane protein assembly factor BamB
MFFSPPPMRISSFFLFVISSALVVTSCQRSAPIKSEPVNLHGGVQRTNAFEQGAFTGKYVFTNIPKNLHEQELKAMRSITPPLLLASGEVVVSTVKGILLYMKNDAITKKVALAKGTQAFSAMVADATDNVYVLGDDGVVHSVTFDGQIRFSTPCFDKAQMQNAMTPLMQHDGVVFGIVKKQGGEMVKVDVDGKILWRQSTPLTPLHTCAATSMNQDGMIVIALTFDDDTASDSLIALDNNGIRRHSFNVAGMRIIAPPVVIPATTGAGYNMLVGGMTNNEGKRLAVLHNLSSTGGTNWSKSLPMLPTGIAVAGDGTIIIKGFNSTLAGQESMVVALDATGKELWRFILENTSIDAPPMISSSSIALVGTQAQAMGVYFLNRTTGKLLNLTSLHDAPIINTQPMVDADGGLVFSGADRLAVVRVTGNVLERLLPY